MFKKISSDTFQYDIEEIFSKIVKTRNNIALNGVNDKYFTRIELLLVGKVLEFTLRISILKNLVSMMLVL